MKLRLHPSASREVDASAFYCEDSEEGLGDDFLDEVEREPSKAIVMILGGIIAGLLFGMSIAGARGFGPREAP